jgi:hypothetical protein
MSSPCNWSFRFGISWKLLGRRLAVQAVGALLAACVFLMVGAMASAQKIVSPPEIAPAPILSQPPAPSAREQSRAPQTEPNPEQQHSADDHRGTEQSPLIVKIQPTPKSSEEAAQAEREKENQAADKWRSDIIAIAIAAAAAVQAAALISTIIVMMCTARRQLRAYVNKPTLSSILSRAVIRQISF